MSFCGETAQFGDGAITYKLANQRPKFFVHSWPETMTRQQFIAACLEAFERWSAVCDVVFSHTDEQSEAQFVIFMHSFDGPSGILADCQFPSPGLRPQQMRIDRGERWKVDDVLLAMLCHEMGHGIGLSHFPPGPPPELMEPSLSSIARPQATESAYAAKLYGPPKLAPTPTPVPPLGDSLGVELIIKASNGQTYKAAGTAKRQ